jgi:hypothetical protein
VPPQPAQFELSMNEETTMPPKTSARVVCSCYCLCDPCHGHGSQGLLPRGY